MDLKGSRTEQNLLAAFAGESQARNRYTFYSQQAVTEGYEQIAELFLETANNEKAHAEQFFQFLNTGEMLQITAEYPAGKVATTAENLRAAAAGEKLEWGTLYPEFMRIAKDEGFDKVAFKFKEIAEVEEYHERRYLKLLDNVENATVFSRSEPVKWKCRNCGYVHEGKNAPVRCPACDHPRSYYELWTEPY